MNWFANADFWSLFYEWMFPAESFEQACIGTINGIFYETAKQRKFAALSIMGGYWCETGFFLS
jgi:hypothetical protein